ncbi:MAG TPA: cupin domain-containing protein [Syntrophorhabdaceae bacterium]|nr:cupin domain-containing protein [Syntrophorhabdaceae bacterium]
MVFIHSSIASENVGNGVERKILASAGKLMTVEVTFQKGAIGALHAHPHEQISYIVRGTFEFTIDAEKYVLKAGDSYYVPPDMVHGVRALEDSVILDVFTPQREDFLK